MSDLAQIEEHFLVPDQDLKQRLSWINKPVESIRVMSQHYKHWYANSLVAHFAFTALFGSVQLKSLYRSIYQGMSESELKFEVQSPKKLSELIELSGVSPIVEKKHKVDLEMFRKRKQSQH